MPDASLADIESVVVPLAGGGGAVAFAVVAAERDANGALTLHGADGRRAYVSPSGAVNYASPEAVRRGSLCSRNLLTAHPSRVSSPP